VKSQEWDCVSGVLHGPYRFLTMRKLQLGCAREFGRWRPHKGCGDLTESLPSHVCVSVTRNVYGC